MTHKAVITHLKNKLEYAEKLLKTIPESEAGKRFDLKADILTYQFAIKELTTTKIFGGAESMVDFAKKGMAQQEFDLFKE